jgi:Xaa-Pro aminopeptidase
MDYHAQRRQALLRNLKKDIAEGILITSPVNVRYLTGFTGDSSYLLLTAKNVILVSDARFEQQIVEEVKDIEVVIRPHTKKLPEATAEVLTKSGLKTVAIEAEHMTISLQLKLMELAPKVTLAPVSGVVEALRAVKDPSEVEKIRLAIKYAERAFKMLVTSIHETDTEKDMTDALEGFIRRTGAEGSAFPSIVAVGERSGLPHAPPTVKPLNDGSKLLVDWGADVGYKSDMTRTIKSPYGPIPTRRNKTERVGYNFDEVYRAVLAAQTEAAKMLKDGVAAKDVDTKARTVLAAAKMRDHSGINLSDYFTHGLGHGIGLEVHESPSIRANSDDILHTGMIVTLEPAVYIPEWGGVRLEDNYLITKEGSIRLTTLPHDPNAIG